MEPDFNLLMKGNGLNPMIAAGQSLPRRFPGCAWAAGSILIGAAEGKTEEMKTKRKKHQQNQLMKKTRINLMKEKAAAAAAAAAAETAMITTTVKKPSAKYTSFAPPSSQVDDALEEAESTPSSLSH